jgi:hypothetical protein
METDVEHPWRKSKSDNVYCRLNNVPNELRSNLIVEDNYVKKIGKFSYKVRVFDDNVLVFREPSGENKKIRTTCKICAENGFPDIQIKWQKKNDKWVPYEYDDSTEVHSHFEQDCEDME